MRLNQNLPNRKIPDAVITMKYKSNLTYVSYICAMKEQMSSFTDFGIERFTGIVLGSFFSVTHHSGHEFNRKITNEKHRAIGFVRPSDDGTEIICIRLAGMTNPMSLIGIFAFGFLIFLLRGGIEMALMPQILIANAVITVVAALISAFTDSITERGQEGSKILTAFLKNPTDFYSQVY